MLVNGFGSLAGIFLSYNKNRTVANSPPILKRSPPFLLRGDGRVVWNFLLLFIKNTRRYLAQEAISDLE